ncbi:MAG: hypothetical protein ABIA47_00335 [bacterium]
MEKIMQIITKYDAKGKQNESYAQLRQRVASIVSQGERLVLLTFTCSTINAQEMFSRTPWKYVALDPQGNNLSNDIQRLTRIFTEIKTIYPNTSLKVLIGNTDPYYIYTRQFDELAFDKARLWYEFEKRWNIYRLRLEQWIKEQNPECDCEVVSWYEFEKDIEKKGRNFEQEFEDALFAIDNCARRSDLDWELRQLSAQFAPGKYFDGLERPGDDMLRDWVRRKFAQYAVQALWIRQYMPSAILIQNEKPSDLRTSMYQPLVREQLNEDFPVLYFCGVDNEGYR